MRMRSILRAPSVKRRAGPAPSPKKASRRAWDHLSGPRTSASDDDGVAPRDLRGLQTD
jgi:hypothetical protein